jgi:hypothetical protein
VHATERSHGDSSDGVEWVGSCTCDCNGEGFGRCFDIPADSAPLPAPPPDPEHPPSRHHPSNNGPCSRLPVNSSVAQVIANKAADYCPMIGKTRQCLYPQDVDTNLCDVHSKDPPPSPVRIRCNLLDVRRF